MNPMCQPSIIHSKYIVVYCIVCSPEGSVRLVNGLSPMEGRVEDCRNGVWGTVSSEGFDSLSLQVVCRSVSSSKLDHSSYHYTRMYMMVKVYFGTFHIQVGFPGIK